MTTPQVRFVRAVANFKYCKQWMQSNIDERIFIEKDHRTNLIEYVRFFVAIVVRNEFTPLS